MMVGERVRCVRGRFVGEFGTVIEHVTSRFVFVALDSDSEREFLLMTPVANWEVAA